MTRHRGRERQEGRTRGPKKIKLSRRQIEDLIEDARNEGEDITLELLGQIRDLLFAQLMVTTCPNCEGTGHDGSETCKCRKWAHNTLGAIHEVSKAVDGDDEDDEDDVEGSGEGSEGSRDDEDDDDEDPEDDEDDD